ncbi:uncharacterized protein MICPUCDRAFT_58544 [Micromonas pusilla CCMP1545]|uniref:Predicted protein n=1 Tax=Micromonas pusilla (strain CCMP1545) TaxID=564608 RepID=C1MTT5_MICPC|nr:uncharacterized protein MICPUCDRAFT_58544 [Micromonas pusilla CCMP1545]EEH56507.1 predicted protein [Micromonas pusilla CCMP1545]|eukprot:XP_003059375.1 predicted protein [Micromonas pusilla CCMP1545]
MKPAHDGDVDPLSLRAVLAGFVVGFVVSAMNVSFGLKAGWAQGGRRVATDRSLAADENASIVATRRRISSRRPSFPPPSDAPSPPPTPPSLPLRAPSSSSPPLVRRSILAAAVSIGLFSALKPKVPFTQAEANICQTVASAAGSMTMAAGLIGPIPALQMLGHKYDGLTIMAWGASVAYLGVFFAVPMRRHFLVDHPLKARSIHWSPYDPVGVVNAVP